MDPIRLACSNVLPVNSRRVGHDRHLFTPLWWLELSWEPLTLGSIGMAPNLGDEKPFKRDPACLVDEQRDLGPCARWLVACKLIWLMQRSEGRDYVWGNLPAGDQRVREDLKTLISRDTPPAHAEEALSWFETWFSLYQPAVKPGRYSFQGPEKALGAAILAALNKAVEAQRGARITEAQFLSHDNGSHWSNLHEAPLRRFEAWLLHGVATARSDLGDLEVEQFIKTPGRREQLEKLAGHLGSRSVDRHLVNLHAEGQSTGLRACIASLIDLLIDARRPKTNASRVPGPPDGPSIIYVRLSRSGDVEEALPTRAGVIRKLSAAFGLGTPLESKDDPRVNLDADLRALRRALTLHRTIVILDAVPTFGDPLGDIIEGARNAQWEDFIRVLVQPDMEVLRRSNGGYPSRFLVTSGQPLRGLGSWCETWALKSGSRSVLQLLYDPKPKPETIAAVETLRARIGGKASASTLPALFPLDVPAVDALASAEAGKPAVSEVELALASLLSTEEVQACVASQQQSPDTLRRSLFLTWYESTAKREPDVLLALQFIACSFNGMRVDTLRRSLSEYHRLGALLGANSPPKNAAGRVREGWQRIEALLDAHRSILVRSRDEPVEALGPVQLIHELHQTPDEANFTTARDRSSPTPPVLFDLRFEELREHFYDQMLCLAGEGEPEAADVDGTNTPSVWDLVQLVLAEESLKQATSQVRNLPSRELLSADSQRRYIQAAAHGLLGLTSKQLSSAAVPAASAPTIEGLALPVEPRKRHRFLFQFVFKHCIENAPEWQLTRAYGRSSLRFELLVLFATPTLGRELIAGRRSLQDVEVEIGTGPIEKLDAEILLALGRAALDMGRHVMVEAVVGALETVASSHPNESLAVEAKHAAPGDVPRGSQALEVQGSQVNSWEALDLIEEGTRRLRQALLDSPSHPAEATLSGHHAVKLRIDSLLMRERTVEVRQIALKVLKNLGVDAIPLLEIGGRSQLLRRERPRAADKEALHAEMTRQVDALLDTIGPRSSRVAAADIMTRLAEAVTIEASKEEWPSGSVRESDGEVKTPQTRSKPTATRVDALGRTLDAFVLYWIADRLRSGPVDDAGPWAIASSRAMRFHVRISLKLACLFAHGPAHQRPSAELARSFYVHARTKLDVYTRHLFRLPRERQAMLLMMATTSRVWAEITSEGNVARVSYLLDSLDYIAQAESVMFELGMTDSVINRFYFERCKTFRRLGRVDKSSQQALWTRLAREDFEKLRTITRGSAFWGRIIDRGMSF